MTSKDIEKLEKEVEADMNSDDEMVEDKPGLSRTMKNVIELIISELPKDKAWDENEICFRITEYFVNRFPGNRLEYQLKRMKMETTGKIKEAIEVYMTYYASAE